MFRSPWEMDVNARYARQRAETEASAQRLAAAATAAGRPRRPALAVAWLCRAVGTGLIAAGERLAGPAGPRPTTTCRVA